MANLNIEVLNNGLTSEKTKVCSIVHAGVFHADDATAVALLNVFYKPDAVHYVVRVPHQADIAAVKNELKERLGSNTEIFTIDIGREYNPDNLEFDHHQYGQGDAEFGHAAAGLVFEYLVKKGLIIEFEKRELYTFIEMVDENDIGIYDDPFQGTIPWAISLMNTDEIYDKVQDAAFSLAVKMVEEIILNTRKRAKAKEKTLNALKEGKLLNEKTLLLPEYLPGWNDVIFDIPEFDDIDIVIWRDDHEDTFKAQVVPDEPGSFGRRGRKIPYTEANEDIIFIHKGEFFGVFKTLDAALTHIGS